MQNNNPTPKHVKQKHSIFFFRISLMITILHRVWVLLILPNSVETNFKLVFFLVGCYATSIGSWFSYCPETSVTTNKLSIKSHRAKISFTAVCGNFKSRKV